MCPSGSYANGAETLFLRKTKKGDAAGIVGFYLWCRNPKTGAQKGVYAYKGPGFGGKWHLHKEPVDSANYIVGS